MKTKITDAMKDLAKFFTILLLSTALISSCNDGMDDDDAEDRMEEWQERETDMRSASETVYKAWNSGDTALVKTVFATNVTRNQNGELASNNIDEYISFVDLFRKAVPDMEYTYEVVGATENKTFVKWTVSGTNTGQFGDQPPTNKPSTTHGLTILTFNDNNKIVKQESFFDQLSYYEPWGYTLIPPTDEQEQ